MNVRCLQRTSRGFTAAELSAVAAIIAILALIIIPIFRDRVDEARRVGTLDDMQGLAKAILLANADTGLYPRLNDLDNGQAFTPTAVQADLEVPIGDTFRRLSAAERQLLPQRWKGPYAAYQNHITLGTLNTIDNRFLSSNNGPIRVFIPFNSAGNDLTGDRYPTDHYGTPYIYFAPGTYIINPATPNGNESNYSSGVIYSLGPDSSPGLGVAPNGAANPLLNPLRRESGVLGTGDDLTYIF